MEYTIGTRVLGDWEIVKKLGEGANGQVFEVRKAEYGFAAESALKLIRIPSSDTEVKAAMSEGMDRESAIGYFQGVVDEIVREIAVMSQLKGHPNIVAYEDHSVIRRSDGIGWDILIRMELLKTLPDYLMEHQDAINERLVVRIGQELCSALVFCQEKKMVHRDIKPANIFVNESGHFKLGDFGIARTVEKTTGGLSKKGTISYMAPEVYLGKPYDADVDLYSLGLVLYMLMNGNRLPFFPPAPQPLTYSDREEAINRRMLGEPLPPPKYASSAFANVILKACAYDRKERYHSAMEMLYYLEHLGEQPAPGSAGRMEQKTAESARQPGGQPSSRDAKGTGQHSMSENRERPEPQSVSGNIRQPSVGGAGQPAPGSRAESGRQSAPGSRAETGRQPMPGNRVEPGRQPAPGSRAEAGRQPAPGSRPGSGRQPAPGSRPESGRQPAPGSAAGGKPQKKSGMKWLAVCAVVLLVGAGIFVVSTLTKNRAPSTAQPDFTEETQPNNTVTEKEETFDRIRSAADYWKKRREETEDLSMAPEGDGALAASVSDGTLTIAAGQGLEGNFSPFFAQSEADSEVVNALTVYTLTSDRVSSPVSRAIEGETRSYMGTDYEYIGAGDVTVTENEDGTVAYDIAIRDDILFSDGIPADIDDVIFSLYVLLDPTYDGAITLYSLPIEGLQEYRAGVRSLFELLTEAGRDNTDYTYWGEATQSAFWADLDQAGAAFAQEIVDYCIANGYNKEGDSVAACAESWGYSLAEDATVDDFFDAMEEAYGSDYMTLSSTESAGSSLQELMKQYDAYSVGITTGDSADSISGIRKLDDYTVRIVTEKLDVMTIYYMSIPIAPLHYYGDESQYDYANNRFGFPKGDLSVVRSRTSAPLGAGPYIFREYADGIVHMDANQAYFKGAPRTAHLNYLECSEEDQVNSIAAGALDLSEQLYSFVLAREIAEANGFDGSGWENLDGPVITTRQIDNGYGYIGINANNVKVGSDPYSAESRALRKALATLIAAYREEAIDAYYGPTALVINYPISNVSWAAPQPTDEGYRTAYSLDVDGNPIYVEDMTLEDQHAAALEAALGYFAAAGYTVENGQILAAPEGAKMGYTCILGGGGTGDHPCFQLLKKASEALAQVGFTLSVDDEENAETLYSSYQNGLAELWCAAWVSAADPDMYQLYHTNSPMNYYQISDAELDGLIEKGLASADQNDRKAIYRMAMEKVMDYAVEIPVYQRGEMLLISSERVNLDSLPGDMTSHWDYWDELEKLEILQ